MTVDLQNVANALWAAGAEAIAINGQRLTATSTIRAAGNAILVDFRPVTSPYEVSAIGPGRYGDDGSTTVRGAACCGEVARSTAWVSRYGQADGLTLPAAAAARSCTTLGRRPVPSELRHVDKPRRRSGPLPTLGGGR